ncbi:hypothetical protein Tco_1517624 [Tanacetum coccineum]
MDDLAKVNKTVSQNLRVSPTTNRKLNEDGPDFGILKEGGSDLDWNSNMASFNSGLATSIGTVGMNATISFAKLVTGELSRKSVNFLTLLAPTGTRADVASFWSLLKFEDGLSVNATKLGIPLILDFYMFVMYTESWGRSIYARAMIKLRTDVELKDTIVEVVLKLVGEVFSMCTIRIEYDSKPPGVQVVRQVVRGVQVGLKLGFKLTKQAYQHVAKNNGASASSRKKQAEFKVVEKGGNFDVVSSTYGTLSEAFGSPNNTPLA